METNVYDVDTYIIITFQHEYFSNILGFYQNWKNSITSCTILKFNFWFHKKSLHELSIKEDFNVLCINFTLNFILKVNPF